MPFYCEYQPICWYLRRCLTKDPWLLVWLENKVYVPLHESYFFHLHRRAYQCWLEQPVLWRNTRFSLYEFPLFLYSTSSEADQVAPKKGRGNLWHLLVRCCQESYRSLSWKVSLFSFVQMVLKLLFNLSWGGERALFVLVTLEGKKLVFQLSMWFLLRL